MARQSKWSPNDRKKLLKLVQQGVSEQEIREQFKTSGRGGNDRPMTAVEFAQQLKTAMVEAGKIKQAQPTKKSKPRVYQVTSKGRLTIADFAGQVGAQMGDRYVLEAPRGRSKSWKLVPVK